MKLAFVKQKFVSFGGGEGYLARLLQAAVDRGHDVHLVTTSWPGDEETPFTRHLIPSGPQGGGRRFRHFSGASAEQLRALQPDLSFTLERTEGADVWRAGEGVHRVWLERRRAFEPGWSTFLSAHTPRQRSLVQLEAACVRDVRCIVANSRTVAEDLRRVYPGLRVPVETIHNGIDLERFTLRGREANRRRLRREEGAGESDRILLFVGSGFHRKGLRESFQALARLPDRQLWVLGRDPAAPWLRLAARLKVADRVRFLPPRRDLVPLYHAADVLVFPSWFESFGFVGLEAAACGTPVVTTRYAGVHECLDEKAGSRILPRPSDTGALAAAIDSLLTGAPDPATVRASVEGASIEANLERTLQVVERIADRA